MPEPYDEETEDEFISRCIEEVSKEKPNWTNKRVVGYCYGLWKSEKTKEDVSVLHKHFYTGKH